MLHGEVDRIIYHEQGSSWSVLSFRLSDTHRAVTVTGQFPVVEEGDYFELQGDWVKHPQYGMRFEVKTFAPSAPRTLEGILRYLKSGQVRGMGEKTAIKIVEHFGVQTIDILDRHPERLAEIPRLGQKKRHDIISSWAEKRRGAEAIMFLLGHGLSVSQAQKVWRLWGPDTVERVSADPYQLCLEFSGIGFRTSDRMGMSLGLAKDSPERLQAATMHAFYQAEERGHCFLWQSQITEDVHKLLQISGMEEKIAAVIAELEMTGSVTPVEEKLLNGARPGETAYLRTETLGEELTIQEKIEQILAVPLTYNAEHLEHWLAHAQRVSEQPLSEKQQEALRLATTSRIFILTGGPGVGKTTTARAIIKCLKDSGRSVTLAAPTGRAAQRLSEVSGVKASTIHRLLIWQEGGEGFARNETETLKTDVLIVDEFSMVDLKLAAALFAALPEKIQLIMIGDVDQLPSIGPGLVLRDFITSGSIPTVHLDEIFRQASASAIVRYAHAINRGEAPHWSKDKGENCYFLETSSDEQTAHMVFQLVTHLLPERRSLDPLREIQILTPMNRGALGTEELNRRLQQHFIGDEAGREQETVKKFFTGDKVIQCVNNYQLGVFNGEIGMVVAAGVEGGGLVVQFPDSRQVTYDKSQKADLQLAYAITIHKSQGSEFPCVVIPMSNQHRIMLQRNLLYTALTRARSFAVLVGSKAAFHFCIEQIPSRLRQTTLGARIS